MSYQNRISITDGSAAAAVASRTTPRGTSARRSQKHAKGCCYCSPGDSSAGGRRRGKIDLNYYTVTYDARSHCSVLVQMWGSDWPRVIPYAAFNVCLMALLHTLHNWFGIYLGRSDKGHQYLTLLISFLLVTRVATSLERYNQAREYLRTMNSNCEQLVDTMVVYSNCDTRDEAKEWRNEVAYRTLLLLRTAMSICDYNSSSSGGIKAVDLPEVEGDVLEDLSTNLPPTRWLHDNRTEYEENLRVPIRISYLLKKSIRSQEQRLHPPIPVIPEGDLHTLASSITDGYQGYVIAALLFLGHFLVGREAGHHSLVHLPKMPFSFSLTIDAEYSNY